MSELGHNGGPDLNDEDRAGNWFAVSRDIFDHPIIGIRNRSYTEMEAWLWLLARANWKPTRVNNKGTIVVLDPGQLMAAHGYLATVWKWSIDKVRYYLQRLANEAMITRYCTNQTTNRRTNQIQVLTICNYDRYQWQSETQHQASLPPTTPSQHQANTKPAPSQHQESNTITREQDNQKKEEEVRLTAPAAVAASIKNPINALAIVAANLDAIAHPDIDPIEAFRLWNETALRCGLQQARSLTPARRKAMVARIREHGGMAAWHRALAMIERSAFLRGQNDRGWRADLDFVLQASRFAKVVDGGYGNGAHGPPPKPANAAMDIAQRIARGEPDFPENYRDYPTLDLKALT